MIIIPDKKIKEIANVLEKGHNCLYLIKTEEIIKISDTFFIDELEKNDCFETIIFEKMSNSQLLEIIIEFVNTSMKHPVDNNLHKAITGKKPIAEFNKYIKNNIKYQRKWNEFKNKKFRNYIIDKSVEDEFENSESFIESLVECHDNEDWDTLLKITKRDAENDSEDLQKQEQYAIALNYNKKYEDTIKLLEPYYRNASDINYGVELILEALYGLNKTENDFNWIKFPRVLYLDDITLKMCTAYLKGKRKPRSMGDICMELYLKSDYLKFDETALGEFLYKYSDIFEFSGSISDFYKLEVKLQKKRK